MENGGTFLLNSPLQNTVEQNNKKDLMAEFAAHDDSIQKIKIKFQKLQTNMMQHVDDKLSEMMGEMIQELRDSSLPHQKSNPLLFDNVKYNNRIKSPKDGSLSDKIFLPRESLLTDLLQIKHFLSIYNVFIAILIILFLNTAVYDVVVTGKLNMGFTLIQWNFGGFHNALIVWVLMMSSTVAVYGCFNCWAVHRINFIGRSFMRHMWDYGWLCLFILYQITFTVLPVFEILKHDLPPASSVALLMEQVRLFMKSHAFVRSNAPRSLSYKPHSDKEGIILCPNFGHFVYFLFVPTLVYRDSYPRKSEIRWKVVTWHLMEIVGVIFYVSFIFERFIIPAYRDYGRKHFSPEYVVMSMFGCMMPAMLAYMCCFFGLLHSWMNAFAEIMQFADRMFYKDWWNANSYAEYYRMWNVVVHDWLYTYIFKDCCWFFKSKNRLGPTLTVFIISAIVHEYILMYTFRFFYPMLFLAFGGFSASLVFLTNSATKGGNVLLWLTLCSGTGVLMSAYSMEWYARLNCPRTLDSVWDFFIPRSWFCNVVNSV